MTAILFTLKSANKKTGPIPVSTSDRDSCPRDCAFIGAGCYADVGPLGGLWTGLTNAGANAAMKNGRTGTIATIGWSELCGKVAALPAGTLWRHNQAGDLPRNGSQIVAADVAALVAANTGRKGFTYSHHNVLGANGAANRKVVADANKAGFTINLSANNLRHADQLAALGIAPVVAVLPADQTANTVTPEGRKVVICPATQRDNITCQTCGLCQRLRDAIIGFPAHGASKRKADAVATA